jgi:hypothetical protein
VRDVSPSAAGGTATAQPDAVRFPPGAAPPGGVGVPIGQRAGRPARIGPGDGRAHPAPGSCLPPRAISCAHVLAVDRRICRVHIAVRADWLAGGSGAAARVCRRRTGTPGTSAYSRLTSSGDSPATEGWVGERRPFTVRRRGSVGLTAPEVALGFTAVCGDRRNRSVPRRRERVGDHRAWEVAVLAGR